MDSVDLPPRIFKNSDDWVKTNHNNSSNKGSYYTEYTCSVGYLNFKIQAGYFGGCMFQVIGELNGSRIQARDYTSIIEEFRNIILNQIEILSRLDI